MEISGMASLSTALSQAEVGDAVSVLVLKKAMAAQAQGALQLLEALPRMPSNPAHLGQNVDIMA